MTSDRCQCSTDLVQTTLGGGVPAVTLHWNKALPPCWMEVAVAGYMSITGVSRPDNHTVIFSVFILSINCFVIIAAVIIINNI